MPLQESKQTISEILQEIKNDPSKQDYLFRRLSTTDKPLPWLEPLKDLGYFAPSHNPEPVPSDKEQRYYRIPYWPLLGFLENAAKHNRKNPSRESTAALVEIVDTLVADRLRNHSVDNYHTDVAILRVIFHLPSELLNKSHIGYIGKALKNSWGNDLVSREIGAAVIPSLLEWKNADLLLQLLSVMFEPGKVTEYEIHPVMHQYWLQETLKKNIGQIAELCGIEAAGLGIGIIRALTNEDKSRFNSVWIPTIDDHSQTNFTERYDVQLTYFVRDMLCLSDPTSAQETVHELASLEHPIYRRMAIHVINHHFAALQDEFWNWPGNPLEIPLAKHELFELLKVNCTDFSPDQIKKVVHWIETKNYKKYMEDESTDRLLKFEAHRKKEWYLALKETGNKVVQEKFDYYDEINPHAIEHPGFDMWSSGMYTRNESPITVDELQQKSAEDIAAYLVSFSDTGKTELDVAEDLSTTFEACVRQDPAKFSANLDPFRAVHPIYLYHLIWGFVNAHTESKHFSWENLLNFISQLIEQDHFWISGKWGKANYSGTMAGEMAGLVTAGTQKDSTAFEAERFPPVENILLTLIANVESEALHSDDPVFLTINSAKGKVLIAMLQYSLRYAKANELPDGNRWKPEIKEEFTKRLNKAVDASVEFATVLGMYLPNLFYLDEAWVKGNIDNILPHEDDYTDFWKATFVGFISSSDNFKKHVYEVLLPHGDYHRALRAELPGDFAQERLVQHLSLAYIIGWAKIGDADGLIEALVNEGTAEQIAEIHSYFWREREFVKSKYPECVKPLWAAMHKRFRSEADNSDFNDTIASFADWLSLIHEIDEDVYPWVELSFKRLEHRRHASSAIEYLADHVAKTPKEVAKLFQIMLDNDVYPDWEQEHIVKIVKELYSSGDKTTANIICNRYGEKGFDFLRTVFEENN